MAKTPYNKSKTAYKQFINTKNATNTLSSKQFPAKKSLGQNFLVDQNYVNKIVAELDPQPNDIIIEIGPGRGALTHQLIESQAKIIAIEIDQDLIPLLQNQFEKKDNFKLVHEDFLAIDFARFKQNLASQEKLKIVANLPYYISTAILSKLIADREHFSEAILMLQKEVAERIVAEPGNSERGFLTVLVEAFTAAEKIFDVPPMAFRPQPKVWSSIVKIIFTEQFKKNLNISDEEFLKIVSAGFAQKRKTILNNLKNANFNFHETTQKDWAVFILEQAQIEPSRRAETLTIKEWGCLADLISQKDHELK